jgi:aminodeoxyfutalosine synthase
MPLEVLTDRSGLRALRQKVEKGGRLSREDGLLLYAHPDLTAVGEMANGRAEALHGRAVGYNVNRHINYSNICRLSCMFCSFAKKLVDEKGIGYEFSMAQILARAKEAADAGPTRSTSWAASTPATPTTTTPPCCAPSRRPTRSST